MNLRSIAFIFLFCGFFHCGSHASDQSQEEPLIKIDIVNNVDMGDHSLRILSEQCSEFKIGTRTYCAAAYFGTFLGWHVVQSVMACTSNNIYSCIVFPLDASVFTILSGVALLAVACTDLPHRNSNYCEAKRSLALINDAILDDEHVDGPIKACINNYRDRNPSRTVSFKDVAKKIRTANQALYFISPSALKGCDLDKAYANCDDLPSTDIFRKACTGIFTGHHISRQTVVDALIEKHETLEADRKEIDEAHRDYKKLVDTYLEQVSKNSPHFFDYVDDHSDAKINLIALKRPHLDLDDENLSIGGAAYNLKYLRDDRPNYVCKLYVAATIGMGVVLVAFVVVDSCICSLTSECALPLFLTSFVGKMIFLAYSLGSVWALPASLDENARNNEFYKLIADAHKIDDADDDNNMTVKLFEEFRKRNPSLKVDLEVLANALQKMNAAGYFLPHNKFDHTASCCGPCNRFDDQPEIGQFLKHCPQKYVEMSAHDLVNDILKNGVPVDLDEHAGMLASQLQAFQKALDKYADLVEEKK